MTAIRLLGLALVTGTVALAATPAAAYQDPSLLHNAFYNELPGPPPLATPAPNAQAAMPKLLEPAVKGKVFTAAPGGKQGVPRRVTLRR